MFPLVLIGITAGALTIALAPVEIVFAIVAAPMAASLAVLIAGGFFALFRISGSPKRHNTPHGSAAPASWRGICKPPRR